MYKYVSLMFPLLTVTSSFSYLGIVFFTENPDKDKKKKALVLFESLLDESGGFSRSEKRKKGRKRKRGFSRSASNLYATDGMFPTGSPFILKRNYAQRRFNFNTGIWKV